MKATKPLPPKRIHRLKNHPFVVPVMTFLGLFVMSLAAFIFLGGSNIRPSDSYVVHLHVDGNKRVMPTRAQTVSDLLEKSQVTINEYDVVEPALDSLITQDNFQVNVYRAHPVTVVQNDKTDKKSSITTYTAQQSPVAIAKQVGIELLPEDKATVSRSENVLQEGIISQKVVIERADVVNINLYGSPVVARTHVGTVAEVLAEKNIKPQPTDTVTPALDTPITPNMQVFIVTVGKQIVTQEEEIPAPVQTVNDPNTAAGQTVVQQAGSSGKKLTTYEIELGNGVEVGRKVIQEVVALEPVARVVAKGTKVVVSNPSENVKIGERMAAERGWTGSEWMCLYQLWQKESRWSHTANNASSGAYGIPQSFPGSKMASVGADWQTNPVTQIQWGLGYIARSYKTPCGAWASSQARGWY